MANKKFWLVILIMTLIFALVLAGCDLLNPDDEEEDNQGDNQWNNNNVEINVPSAPTGVMAAALSSSSISVSWYSVSGATSYDVYYAIDSSSTKKFAGNTTSTSYTHTGLTASTTCYYFIKAKNSAGESEYSLTSSATTQSSSGGDPADLIAKWYSSQEEADTYSSTLGSAPIPIEFTSYEIFIPWGSYTYSATNNTVTIYSESAPSGTWTFSYIINGTILTLFDTANTPFSDGNYYKSIPLTLKNVTANGSATDTTTQLTLTFDRAVPGLTANDITLSGVSGVSKGTLSGSGPTYTLDISGFTSGGTLTVGIRKPGYYNIGSLKTVAIYCIVDIKFSSLTANGSSTQTTTQLTLTFDRAVPGLTANDITLSGMSVYKDSLSGSGTTYYLYISGVSSSGTLNVSVAKSGCNITGSPKSVSIYYYYSAPQPNTNPPGNPTLNVTRSGNLLNLTWSFPTGSNYGRPDSIKVRVYDPTYSVWVDIETLSGTATSYSFNYTMWVASNGGVQLGIIGTNSYSGQGLRAGTFNTNTGVWY